MRRASQQGRPPRSGRYRHPYHPALVTVPIGAWAASLVFDIASHVVSKPAFLTVGSRWLIAIGIAGAAIASLAGFMDLASIPERTEAYRTACAHMAINVVIIFAYAGNLLWRERAASSATVVGTGMLALSAASVALLVLSGFLGGRLTFRLGVGVADQVTHPAVSRASRHNVPPGAGYR
jgi:uncharacterized membrane protein